MTTYYAKDANGNQFPVTPTPIGQQASAASISTVNASDALAEPGGVPITGASMPTGGSGLTGWLSAIWQKLSGALIVSGSGAAGSPPVNNPVSIAGFDGTNKQHIRTDSSGNVQVADSQSAPFQGSVAMTAGTTYASARSVEVDCTTPGTVTFTFPDSSTRTIACSLGTQTFPYAVTKWTSPDGFVGNVFNMK